jgi:hypothetical protein
MDRDQVFVPATRSHVKHQLNEEIAEISPIVNIFWIVIMVTLGWPCYLLYNAAGQQYPQFTSHYLPKSPIFKKQQVRHSQSSNSLSQFNFCAIQCLFIAFCKYILLIALPETRCNAK